METIRTVVLILCAYAALVAQQIQFEGLLPFDIDKASTTADYYRYFKALAPMRQPDSKPLRIVYLASQESAVREYGLPEWGGGGAIGRDLIIIPTINKPFLDLSYAQVTRHELVHSVLSRAYPSFHIPRWFHEGAAMALSGELSFEENIVISKALFTGSILKLSSIDSVNGFGRNKADLAYSQSHAAVLFFIDNYGIDVLPEILNAGRKSGSFWQGVYNVLSISPDEFEKLVHASLSSKYSLLFIFTDYYAFWILIAGLFLVAVIVTIFRKRKQLETMEQLENVEQPKIEEPQKILHFKHLDNAPEEYSYDEEDDDDRNVLSDDIELEEDEEDQDEEDDGSDDFHKRK